MLPRRRALCRRLSVAFILMATAPPLAGCVADKTTVAEPPATCNRIGDTCTFSPGKLGLCVESTDGSARIICQSQH